MKTYTAPIYNELDPETSEWLGRCPGSEGGEYARAGIISCDYKGVTKQAEGDMEVTVIDSFPVPDDWTFIS